MSAYTDAIQMPDVATLLANVQHGDARARTDAIAAAPLVGVGAIPGLAEVYESEDPAATRAASECLRRIVHNAARPGAAVERADAAAALAALITQDHIRQLRVDAIHWLGLVGGPSEVAALAAQLADLTLRENVRLAIERLPCAEADRALRTAYASAGDDYRDSIELSLRARARRRRR